MARVSTRFGIGRSTPAMLGISALNLLVAALAWAGAAPGLLIAVLLGAAGLGLLFAFVHADRVVELDDDDEPSRRVGDPADE
ncbi:MAG: hypothetical protein OZ921_14880 [Sorangiineae bacterium]|nr:hypothetical protein [Polyangiaceae bacterium]MEB2323794.1 hypothetical protein [Sorangiineae bacterium]